MAELKAGCYIKIKNMKSEPEYSGKVGKVILIDDANQIHGTWGGCALIPEVDEFEVLPDERMVRSKRLWLNELLKCYDKNDLNVKEIPNARLSESMETCFCPYCMRMEFIKEGNVIRTCKECGRKYFIKF